MSDLKHEHEMFCQEFVKHWNGTKAYMVVYPDASEETARVNASKLLTNTNIEQRISELKRDITQRNEIELDDIVNELKLIGFSNIQNYYNENSKLKKIADLPQGHAKAIASVRTIKNESHSEKSSRKRKSREFKLHDKIRALDMLMKYKGGYQADNEQRLPDYAELMQMPYEERVKMMIQLQKKLGDQK